jgi:glycosyltransferase involved in cell wall biosynthesis
LRVGIDLTALLPSPTGVDTYLERLVGALAATDPRTRYTVFANAEDRRRLAEPLPENFEVLGRCLRPRPVRLLFQQLLLPAFSVTRRLDVLHSPSFIMPMMRSRPRHLLTVYDMTFFSHPACHERLRRSAPYRRAIVLSLRRADLVTVPSESAAGEVLRYVPEVQRSRLKVVPPGIGEEFRPAPAAEVDRVRAGLGLDRPYLLYVGTIEPRKNLVRLVEAFSGLAVGGQIDEDLVLAGKLGWGYEPVLEAIRHSGCGSRIRRVGYVARENLPALLSGARLFVYPSLAEGFGFPPLEAMACGVPTIAARSTSLAENLEGAAELVPADDAPALAAAILKVLRDPGVRSALRERGRERAARFRWERTAELTADCYRALGPGMNWAPRRVH